MNDHTTRVQELLHAFDTLLDPGPAPLSRRIVGGRHSKRVVFGAVVHGNEIGSLPGVMRVMRELEGGELSFGGTLDVFVGNAPAALRNVRMLEADLNRVFTPQMPDSAERRRAVELEPILSGCDLFVDLHQTLRPTEIPFYTLPWLPVEAQWVRALGGGEAWLTRPAGTPFDAGTCCTDEFVRNEGKPGLTLELGTHGFDPRAEALAAATLRRALELMDAVAECGPDALAAAAAAAPEVPLWMLTHAEPYSDRGVRLREGTHNFQRVRAGDNLAAEGAPPLVVPRDGVVMFPKFTPADQPLPASVYRLAERMLDDPRVVWASAP